LKLLRGKLWNLVIALCHIYYPLWNGFVCAESQDLFSRPDLLRVGPVALSESESVCFAGEGLAKDAGLRLRL
jgi:hypothetical protein